MLVYSAMGAIFRLKDLPTGWRKLARESIKDFSPDTKDSILKIMDSWEGAKPEEELMELLGHDKAESFMKKITGTTTNKSTLTNDQQNQVIFSETLTFD
jgi:hypothetical protein